jgi:hypothetical protein
LFIFVMIFAYSIKDTCHAKLLTYVNTISLYVLLNTLELYNK